LPLEFYEAQKLKNVVQFSADTKETSFAELERQAGTG
jgi:hypothetical protein